MENNKGDDKMTENLKDTLKSLLTKLSAVRVTLTDEEQSLLDQLILSSSEEVQAHYKVSAPDEARAFGADEARAMALKYQPDEAKAMGADEAKAMALKYQPDEAKALYVDEAKAMALQFKPDEAKALGSDEARAMAKQFTPDEAKVYDPDEAKGMRLFVIKPAESRALDTDEVTAHSIPTSVMMRPGAPNPMWVKIIYDPMM